MSCSKKTSQSGNWSFISVPKARETGSRCEVLSFPKDTDTKNNNHTTKRYEEVY